MRKRRQGWEQMHYILTMTFLVAVMLAWNQYYGYIDFAEAVAPRARGESYNAPELPKYAVAVFWGSEALTLMLCILMVPLFGVLQPKRWHRFED